MANPAWPETFPDIQFPQPDSGYVRKEKNQGIKVDMDDGPAKRRRRFTSTVVPFTITFEMDQDQVEDLEDFYHNTLGVVGAFDWLDHLDRTAATLVFDDAPAYAPLGVSEDGTAWWKVTLSLEVQP